MIMMTFPALLLVLFGYSAIQDYKNKKAMNDEIQLHDGPQSEAQKNKERIAHGGKIRRIKPAVRAETLFGNCLPLQFLYG